MTIQYIEHPELRTIELTIDGRVTEADYDQVIPQIESFIQKQPDQQIKILEVIKQYNGFDFSVLGKGMQFDLNHRKNYQKCAVVSDSGLFGAISRLAGMFLSCEIRTFKLNEISQAREWLKT